MTPIKRYIYSSLATFLTVFTTAISLQIQSGVEWTSTFWLTVLITAARAGVKAVMEAIIEHRLATGKPV